MQELAPGTRFAGYEIEAVAGRGGMGVVYRARQSRPGRTVAIKLISPELAREPGFRERFERESELAAAIEHPNVIPVYEVDEHERFLYIVMRFVPGTDLAALVRRAGALAPGRAAGVVAQIASALDAAHARGLVHRDVKSANVLIAGAGADEHAYLTDFGLTKAIGSESGLTQSGTVVGTMDYIAPEQLAGTGVDARADVYSLGCVLYEALTGGVPFPRDSQPAKMWAHMNAPPPSPAAATGACPPAFDAVVARALAKDRDARYPSAGDLGRAARAAAEGRLPSEPERSVARGEAAFGASATAVRPERPTAPSPGAGAAAAGGAAAGGAAVGAAAAGGAAAGGAYGASGAGGAAWHEARTDVLPAGRRGRGAIALAVAGAVALAAGAGAVAALLATGDSGDAPERGAAETRAAETAATGEETRETTPATETADRTETTAGALDDVELVPYEPPSGGYATVVPSGPGWVVGDEANANTADNPLYRTEISGPGGLGMLIVHTPNEPARFPTERVRLTSRRQLPHEAFGTMTEYVFTDGGGLFALCTGVTCVDYQASAGGAGYAILAGGPDAAAAREIGRAVAAGIRPR